MGKRLIWGLILLFSFIYSLHAVLRYLRFDTGIFDLGYYDQLIWLVAHGKPLYSSILEAHPWVDHFSPTILLLAPLYWLWSDPRMLLIFQAIFICLGAYPIYLLSLKKTKSLYFSLLIAFCYLSFYGLQNAIAFDFHALALAPTLIAYLFWFYEEKLFGWFWIAVFLLAGLQENFMILNAALGLYLIVRHRDFRRGIILILFNAIYFLLLIYLIIPRLGGSYYYLPKQLGLFYAPTTKLVTVGSSLLAFGFLPVFFPPIFILLGEEFLGRFIFTTNSNWWVIGYQYDTVLVVFLTLGVIEVVHKYALSKNKFVWGLLIIGMLITQINGNALKWWFDPSFNNQSKSKDKEEIISMIPKEETVAATNDLGSHLAERQGLIFLTNCQENSSVWGRDSKRCFKLQPEYIVANLDPVGSTNNWYPDYSRDSLLKYLDNVIANKNYKLIKKSGDLYLLKLTESR